MHLRMHRGESITCIIIEKRPLASLSLSLSPSRLLEYFILYKMRERASAGEPSFSRIISVFTKPDTRHAVRINKLSYPSLVDISSFFSLLLVTCKYRAEYHPLGALKSCKEYNSDRLVEMKNMKRVCQCRMIREEKKRRLERKSFYYSHFVRHRLILSE